MTVPGASPWPAGGLAVVRLSPRLRPMWPYLKPAYTQATRMVAPATVRASQLRGGYLPTGYVESMEEAAPPRADAA